MIVIILVIIFILIVQSYSTECRSRRRAGHQVNSPGQSGTLVAYLELSRQEAESGDLEKLKNHGYINRVEYTRENRSSSRT